MHGLGKAMSAIDASILIWTPGIPPKPGNYLFRWRNCPKLSPFVMTIEKPDPDGNWEEYEWIYLSTQEEKNGRAAVLSA